MAAHEKWKEAEGAPAGQKNQAKRAILLGYLADNKFGNVFQTVTENVTSTKSMVLNEKWVGWGKVSKCRTEDEVNALIESGQIKVRTNPTCPGE